MWKSYNVNNNNENDCLVDEDECKVINDNFDLIEDEL